MSKGAAAAVGSSVVLSPKTRRCLPSAVRTLSPRQPLHADPSPRLPMAAPSSPPPPTGGAAPSSPGPVPSIPELDPDAPPALDPGPVPELDPDDPVCVEDFELAVPPGELQLGTEIVDRTRIAARLGPSARVSRPIDPDYAQTETPKERKFDIGAQACAKVRRDAPREWVEAALAGDARLAGLAR